MSLQKYFCFQFQYCKVYSSVLPFHICNPLIQYWETWLLLSFIDLHIGSLQVPSCPLQWPPLLLCKCPSHSAWVWPCVRASTTSEPSLPQSSFRYPTTGMPCPVWVPFSICWASPACWPHPTWAPTPHSLRNALLAWHGLCRLALGSFLQRYKEMHQFSPLTTEIFHFTGCLLHNLQNLTQTLSVSHTL